MWGLFQFFDWKIIIVYVFGCNVVSWCLHLEIQDFIMLKFSYTEAHKIYTHLWGAL